MKVLATIATLLALITVPVNAADRPRLDPERTVVLDDTISIETTKELVNALYSFTESKGEVSIVIDSYGGNVGAGLRFIRAMQAVKDSGSKISCVVVGPTASMAAWIFTKCDKRYIVPEMAILYHFSRIVIPANTPATASDLVGAAEQLTELDNLQFKDVLEATGLDELSLMMAMLTEAWLSGEALEKYTEGKFLKVWLPTEKLQKLLKNEDVPKASSAKLPRGI